MLPDYKPVLCAFKSGARTAQTDRQTDGQDF